MLLKLCTLHQMQTIKPLNLEKLFPSNILKFLILANLLSLTFTREKWRVMYLLKLFLLPIQNDVYWPTSRH